MTTKQFTALVFVLIAVLLVMLLVEDYRRCIDAGYTDCPSPGSSIWRGPKKLHEPS